MITRWPPPEPRRPTLCHTDFLAAGLITAVVGRVCESMAESAPAPHNDQNPEPRTQNPEPGTHATTLTAQRHPSGHVHRRKRAHVRTALIGGYRREYQQPGTTPPSTRQPADSERVRATVTPVGGWSLRSMMLVSMVESHRVRRSNRGTVCSTRSIRSRTQNAEPAAVCSICTGGGDRLRGWVLCRARALRITQVIARDSNASAGCGGGVVRIRWRWSAAWRSRARTHAQ